MAGVNITEVRLLSVPLENDYLHTLYFADKSAQANYFLGKEKHKGTEYSYQRKDGVIRFHKQYDKLLDCNYVMYKNAYYTDKWFYAFITKMEYKDDGMTEISIETDVIQSWMFDYTVKSSFVEREHVSNDTVGINTVPEGLESGDYIINSRNANESLLVHSLIIASTLDLNNPELSIGGAPKKFPGVSGKTYNGLFSGVKYYKVTSEQAQKIIFNLSETGQSDGITSIFVCPSLFIDATTPSEYTIPAFAKGPYPEVDSGQKVDFGSWINTFGVDEEEIYKPTTLNGYTPKNKKLLCYPYSYMLMSNNSGGSAVYKYELFNCPDDANKCDFRIYSTITPGMSIRIIPRYYNGTTNNNDEGLTLGKFPICSWNTDVYTNWLTQNSVNIGLSITSSVAQTGIGIAGILAGGMTGGLSAVAGASALTSGITAVASTLGEVYQHSLQPPQVEGNLNSGDVSFSAGYLTFTAHHMSIKKEYAQIIDEYFTMYGYKVNRVKVPNKNHRANFWYTKTIDVNIDGAIPMEDMKKIKDCYNRGITFWKNASNIGNYSVSNTIS